MSRATRCPLPAAAAVCLLFGEHPKFKNYTVHCALCCYSCCCPCAVHVLSFYCWFSRYSVRCATLRERCCVLRLDIRLFLTWFWLSGHPYLVHGYCPAHSTQTRMYLWYDGTYDTMLLFQGMYHTGMEFLGVDY